MTECNHAIKLYEQQAEVSPSDQQRPPSSWTVEGYCAKCDTALELVYEFSEVFEL